MFRRVVWFFIAGFLIAITIEGLWRMLGYYSPSGYMVERVARVLWPSSIFKMALSDRDSWKHISLVYGLSFVTNGVAYGLLGFLVGIVKDILAPPRLV